MLESQQHTNKTLLFPTMSVTDETKAVAPEATITTVPAETKSTKEEEQPVEKAADDVPVEDKAEEAKVSGALPMHSRIPERAALLCFIP